MRNSVRTRPGLKQHSIRTIAYLAMACEVSHLCAVAEKLVQMQGLEGTPTPTLPLPASLRACRSGQVPRWAPAVLLQDSLLSSIITKLGGVQMLENLPVDLLGLSRKV